jgi:7,8-dihydropterin-6-yl-methyl-4-(beta-D-ribofuranosyl)aminobenzene 5'-phosphate synthase
MRKNRFLTITEMKEATMRKMIFRAFSLILFISRLPLLWGGELHEAVEKGDLTKIKQLLQADPKLLQAPDNDQHWTPLHYAVWGQKEVAEYLLSLGANANATDEDGYTPLHLACLDGNQTMAALLIAKGAQVNVQGKDGTTPLHFAVNRGQPELIRFLVAKGSRMDPRDREKKTPFLWSAGRGKTDIAEVLLSLGANRKAKDWRGRNALHLAAWHGHKEMVQLLIHKGLKIETQDDGGDTPLHGAVYGGHNDVGRMLLAKGAKSDTKNRSGRTPLEVALARGNQETIRLLLQKGAKEPERKTEPAATTKFSVSATPIGDSLRITDLYDNYLFSPGTQTNWGFACLVEGAGKVLLFDTGTHGSILLHNFQTLRISETIVQQLAFSHEHGDHIGGVSDFLKKNSTVDVFLPYSFTYEFFRDIEQKGAKVISVKGPQEIQPNVFLTGELGKAIIEQALVLNTSKGLVIITGCAHPGVVEIVKKAKEMVNSRVYLVMGGFHLLNMKDDELRSILEQFKALGVQKVGAAHCTGDRAIGLFKEAYRENCVPMGTGKVVTLRD